MWEVVGGGGHVLDSKRWRMAEILEDGFKLPTDMFRLEGWAEGGNLAGKDDRSAGRLTAVKGQGLGAGQTLLLFWWRGCKPARPGWTPAPVKAQRGSEQALDKVELFTGGRLGSSPRGREKPPHLRTAGNAGIKFSLLVSR